MPENTKHGTRNSASSLQGVWRQHRGRTRDSKPSAPPCPKCGGDQIFSAVVNATADVALGRRLAAREPGRKKPTVEMRADHTISKCTSEPVFHERTIDRRQDRYSERVTLKKTGKVIHSCDEPLSSHKGHGSARRRRRRK